MYITGWGLNKPLGFASGFIQSPPSYTLAHLEYITMATLHLFPFHVQLLACKRLVAMVIYSKSAEYNI